MQIAFACGPARHVIKNKAQDWLNNLSATELKRHIPIISLLMHKLTAPAYVYEPAPASLRVPAKMVYNPRRKY